MPMPRATFFFQDRTYGWSETHWRTLSSEALDIVLAKAQALAVVRSDLLGLGPTLTAIRVSDDFIKRDSLVAVNQSPNNAANWEGAPAYGDEESDLPYSVTLLRAESGTLYRKNMYLSGVPDSMQVDRSQGIYSPLFLKNFDAWVQELRKNWGFRVVLRPPDVVPKAITGITGTSPFIVTSAGHGLVSGNQIQVQNVAYLGLKNLVNKKWYVSVVDGDSFTLLNSTGTITYLGGGEFYLRVPDVKPYGSVVIRGQTHRKRGRPFDSPRGRRKRT